MPSEPGSQGPSSSSMSMPMGEFRERAQQILEGHQGVFDRLSAGPREGLTTEEQQAVADGEPYCFRCGKPASSFSEYASNLEECQSYADYVREEEGTYNPHTNRFACDACYIAIGMPAGPAGWLAP